MSVPVTKLEQFLIRRIESTEELTKILIKEEALRGRKRIAMTIMFFCGMMFILNYFESGGWDFSRELFGEAIAGILAGIFFWFETNVEEGRLLKQRWPIEELVNGIDKEIKSMR